MSTKQKEKFKAKLFKLLEGHGERGASLVEYAMLIGLIVVIAVPSIKALAGDPDTHTGVSGKITYAAEEIAAAGNGLP